jgi:glucosamine--fructose-6-phosphate aminotransferase (isomerizing)
MISAALDGGEPPATLPDAAARALEAPGADEIAARHAAAERLVILGRGFNFSTAHEIALKLKETSYVHAEAHSWVDFQHGPAALIEPGLPVVLCAPSSPLLGDLHLLFGLFDRGGAHAVAISDREEVLAGAVGRLRLPAVPEWLSPIVAVIPGQLLALAFAAARGIDPDAPRGLSKVTETR